MRVNANVDSLQTIKAGLESQGFKPEIHELAWFHDDYGLEVDDDVEGADDDSEDGDNDDDEESDSGDDK